MASNPVTYVCAAGVWVRVAQDKTTGMVYIIDETPRKYVQTIRVTGEDAPTDTSDAAKVEGLSFGISSDEGIDVYIMAIGAAGKVRVDL